MKNNNEITPWKLKTIKTTILKILEDKPSTGYEIMKEIKTRSMGMIDIKSGIIYPTLKKMEEEDFIKGKWDNVSRKKKIYTLTEKGIHMNKKIHEYNQKMMDMHISLFKDLGFEVDQENFKNSIGMKHPEEILNDQKLSKDEKEKRLTEIYKKIDSYTKLLEERKQKIKSLIASLK
jgi:DNA-binding PadR family transcriptional regulator